MAYVGGCSDFHSAGGFDVWKFFEMATIHELCYRNAWLWYRERRGSLRH